MLTMNGHRILVVDDEEDLCEILRYNLENENYTVDVAYSAEEAMALGLENYDLILLDVMMGEISGFKMANIMKKRKETAGIPIIFLTAKDTENDICTGLNIGADDYISKPYSIREVMLRIKAVLRRAAPGSAEASTEGKITFGELSIDTGSKKVEIQGRPAPLTKKEFEILLTLVKGKGRVFSREDILERVWKDEAYVLDRTVDVNITRLRKKIGEYGKYITTRMGYGYCFDDKAG